MNPDPLAALQPLRLPAEPGWWPPAPGWWVLAGLLLLALTGGLWMIWRRWQRNRYRRVAAAALQAVASDWQAHRDAARLVQQTNRILKATSLRAWPRSQVAPLSGGEWLTFLQQSCPQPLPALEPLAEAGYARGPEEPDAPALLAAAELWVRRHRGPRS
ncbi:MAG: hypothetical protein CME40_16280 [Haliea sp.]|nr:hypothetical protein [Haliea sp.]|tara:strand:- start:181507 stop:181983 length:477 start_codon:yes stop_codon:yes gene_type:complete